MIEIILLKENQEFYFNVDDSQSPGRSRQQQGLAAAMVKLWERSSIAKISLKRGVQLTTSERMAEDLKVNENGSS